MQRDLVGRELLAGLGANPIMAAQSGLDKVQSGLDGLAAATMPFPVVGDLAGLGADALAFAREPRLLDLGLMGLGALPLVPSLGTIKRVGRDATAPAARSLETPSGRRGTKQGFAEQPFFHGTSRDLKDFDPSKAGAATATADLNRQMSRQPAAFLTSEPLEAGLYAENAARTTSGAGANIMPLRVRAERPIKLDAEGLSLDSRELRVSLDVAADIGLQRYGQAPDVVFVQNLPPVEAGGKPITMAVVFDPAKIRSVFAQFDRKRLSSSDLLAGLAGAGLLVSATDRPDRDE